MVGAFKVKIVTIDFQEFKLSLVPCCIQAKVEIVETVTWTWFINAHVEKGNKEKKEKEWDF